MPWKVFKKGEKYKVYEVDEAGEPVGDALGTHESEKEAAQARALYANESGKAAVKFSEGSKTEIVGLLAPFGGPFNGRDIAGEYFSSNTDFALEWFSERPALFHHGLDGKTGISVIGRIKSLSKDELGLWMRAQLDANHEYYSAIKELIEAGKLGLSSGSMRHLVEVNKKTGEILRWPLIEGSLTPTPANPLAELGFAEVKSHFKTIGLDLPADIAAKMGMAMAKRMMKDMAAEMDMEMSDDEMSQMMAKMGDMSEMDEDAAKEKMRKLLQPMAKKSIKAVSWEDIRQECGHMIEQQLAAAVPFGDSPGYCYVEGTYNDCVVCCICKGGVERHYCVPFELGEDGHVAKLGTPTEVEQGDWKPVEQSMENIPMGMHAEMAMRYATSLLERTKDLRERRTKEGRVLSTATRKRLGQCLDAMRGATDEMQGLLESTEPPAKAGEVLRLQALLMGMRAKTLTWR